jgi:vanillate O-demethylase ferredoxin subunit
MTPALLSLRLTRIEYAAAGIHLFEFRTADGADLPPFAAGAHIDLHLPGGFVRQYSLCNAAHERHRYVVAIKRDAQGRGGSAAVHDTLRVGQLVDVAPPRCHFALDEAAPHSLLIAGGIGITPVACMVQRLRQLGRPFAVHYSVRKRDEAALLDVLAGPELTLHVDAERGAMLDVPGLVAAAPADAVAYCCGPAPMLDAFEAAARARPGLAWRVERFVALADAEHAPAHEGGFTVKLAASGRSVPVRHGETILEALRAAGLDVPSSCEQGICGTCETRVLEGLPDHRDSLLSDEERRSNRTMMICCSGSRSAELVLDL